MQRLQIYACLVTAIMVGWAVLVGVVPSMSAGLRVDEDFSEIPLSIGKWDGAEGGEFDDKTYRLLPTCSLLSRDYIDDLGNRVNLSIVYGRELGDFHQPEICMEGVGWKRTGSRQLWLKPKDGKQHKATVITMTNDFQDIVMVYWFYMGGDLAPSMGKEKLRALVQGLVFGKLSTSAMVKFTAPVIVDEESAEESAVRLAELLDRPIIEMADKPVKFVPSDAMFE